VRFIATEYIEGKTIREVISDKDLSLAEVLEVAEQVAFALSAAHAAGIVHRDIKPENIMRRKDGIVKILDFGIAKLMEPTTEQFAAGNWTLTSSKTEVGVVIGTAAYMSPEQARGLAIDERTDIWSLGVVLYEMLSRRQPFSGSTRLDTMVSILEREPAPLCDPESNASPVLQELQRIVSKTLCKDRDERYQTATELLADLQDARHQLESEPESDALRLIPITDVRTVRVILIAALLIPAIIVGSILYNRYRLHANTSNPGSASTPTMKLYSQMSDDEQLAFLHNQEQRISAMMGERPAKLNDDAIQAIKRHVDRYVARADSQAVNHGEDALPVIYSRAAPFAPMIARAFSNRKIPIIVGIYLPMIESEYEACHESPLGANGLFQFLPQTAQSYGVEREDMCNAEKMSPAAAHYIADRMAELGEDAESMTLVLLSYNTGAEAVRDALRRVRDKPKFERNFWTLLANRDKLGDVFRKESAGYVPRFFAAAIIGENPQNFGLQTPALSSLAGDSSIR
jgi:serine/threonine protein kinase